MSNDSKTEEIRLGVIGKMSFVRIVNFRSHKSMSSTFLKLTLFFKVQNHSEVNNGRFHRININNNILRLNVPMNNIPLMTFLQTFCYSCQNHLHIFYWHSLAISYHRHQIYSLQVFCHQYELILALEHCFVLRYMLCSQKLSQNRKLALNYEERSIKSNHLSCIKLSALLASSLKNLNR